MKFFTALLTAAILSCGATAFAQEENVNFADLPVKDAITVVQGSGTRKLAVFADPNCSHCKQFEKNLQSIDDATVHVFLLPILGKDSREKARDIWCAPDRATAWHDYMLNDKTPQRASCDASALQRNLTLAQKLKVRGTPTVIFSNGSIIAGALPASEVEKQLSK